MKLTEFQRIAVCCILLDVSTEMQEKVSLADTRHYAQLKEKGGLTDEDFNLVQNMSVLTSLIILKDIPYNIKMLLGLTVYGLYAGSAISIKQRMAFELLMSSIDWPISYSEVSSLI